MILNNDMKYFVWSDFDLDGSGSLLLFKWLYPDAIIDYKTTKIGAFKEEFVKWKNDSVWKKYDKIVILDLDVADYADLVDDSKVIIIDHHLSHFEKKNVYKHAEVHVKEFPSCIAWIYKTFDNGNLTKQQKHFIAIVNDYDSYVLKFPESKQMNYLFSDMQKGDFENKIDRFMHIFKDGFKGFSTQENNIIKFHEQKVKNTINTSVFYKGFLPYGGKKYTVGGVVADTAINEVCDYIIRELKYDIAICMNSKTQSVSFRTVNPDVDASKIAAILCEGGGHKQAAGGKFTDKFAKYTQTLIKVS